MDISKAKEIVGALAEGIDPITGEILPLQHQRYYKHVLMAIFPQ